MGEVETEVLIVGGGPVGLATAILASAMGARACGDAVSLGDRFQSGFS